MSQQPFSRPGAVDLSGLKRPAASTASSATSPTGGAGRAGGAYSVDLTEQNLQEHLEASMNAPVLLVVYSPSRAPESAQLADDLDVIASELEGRLLLGRIDVDQQPRLAQALQIPSVPLVALVAQGRMLPLLQDAPPLAQLRPLVDQVLQQMVTQALTGRHQPLSLVGERDEQGDEPLVDP